MSTASRLVIAIVLGVTVSSLVFCLSALAASYSLGSCTFITRDPFLCTIAGFGTYGCFLFPVPGVLVFATTFFALPKQ